jgi:hypothetical protein
MRRILAVACFTTILVLSLMAQSRKELEQALSPESMKKFHEERDRLYQWDNFKFLMGTWKTESAAANAGFQVTPTLDGKVLVISNSEPGIAITAKEKSANYKSLTYVYLEGLTARATFYDSQGRVRTYDVQAAPQKLALVSTATPRNRIVFEENKDGAVSIAVESGTPTTLATSTKIQAVRVSK